MADSRTPDSGPDVHSPDATNDVEIIDVETDAATSAPVEHPVTRVELPVTPVVDTGYTAGGVPTFESVREKIETRVGTAIGSVELASETPEGRQVEEQYEARQRAAAERVAQIRASMRDTPDPKSGQA